MNENRRIRMAMQLPRIAMVVLDVAIALMWIGMWRAGAGRSQSVIGWSAFVLCALLTAFAYKTLTPYDRRTVRWSKVTVVNAMVGLVTAIHFHGVVLVATAAAQTLH